MVGGTGGSEFSFPHTDKTLTKITIWVTEQVNKLRCEYADGSNVEFGNNDGTLENFFFSEDDQITNVEIWANDRVRGIQWVTTSGRRSKAYGSSAPTVPRFGFVGNGHPLMGFKGRSGNSIDALEPVWSDKLSLDGPYIAVSNIWGGPGGNSFDMLDKIRDRFKARLTTVVIRSADHIDAIECKFNENGKKGPEVQSGKKGGDGGQEQAFMLEEDEYIVRIVGTSALRVHSLQFITNKRASQEFGKNTGNNTFDWRPPPMMGSTNEKPCMSLLCFQGSAGAEVDALAPVWTPNPPVRYELQVDPLPSDQVTKNLQVDSTTTVTVQWYNGSKGQDSRSTQITEGWSKTTTLTLSDESTLRLGGKMGVELGFEAGGGIPGLGEAKATSKVSVEASIDHESKENITNGAENKWEWSMSETFTKVIEPGEGVVATAEQVTASLKDVEWTGTVIAWYEGGGKRRMKVAGKVDCALMSTHKAQSHAMSEEEKAAARKEGGH